MFQIDYFIEARLATVTNRIEKHGEDDKPAVTLTLEIETTNTLLDLIDPRIRHALYMPKPDSEPELPGVEASTPILRCNAFEKSILTVKYEGWTLHIDATGNEEDAFVFGGAKCDKFVVIAKQGGTILLNVRVGTSDLDAEKSGMLAMHNGQAVWVKLIAPKPKLEAIDGSVGHPGAGKTEPDAGDMFSEQHGDESEHHGHGDGPAGAFDRNDGDDQDDEDGPADSDSVTHEAEYTEAGPVTIERSQPASRTARGREKTSEAIAEGMANHAASTVKYRGPDGETWSGHGLQPKWVKKALAAGQTLAQLEESAVQS